MGSDGISAVHRARLIDRLDRVRAAEPDDLYADSTLWANAARLIMRLPTGLLYGTTLGNGPDGVVFAWHHRRLYCHVMDGDDYGVCRPETGFSPDMYDSFEETLHALKQCIAE